MMADSKPMGSEGAANKQGHRRKGPRLSIGGVDRLAGALRQGSYGSFEAHSPFAATLFPLLKALDWRGSLRELFEALPHFANSLDIGDLRNVLALLGFATYSRRIGSLKVLDERLLPCVAVSKAGDPYVIFEKTASGYLVFDATKGEELELPDLPGGGSVYLLSKNQKSDDEKDKKKTSENWFLNVVRRFDKVIARLLVVTFFINMIALAIPLFILTIYDQVIPIRALDVLTGLAIGAGIALSFDLMLRIVRARMIAFVGARIEHIVAVGAFRKILSLPPAMTESAPLGDQVAKVRDFDSLRDIFTSLLVTVGLELPFVVIFLGVLVYFSPLLGAVPVAMIVVYALLWWLLSGRLRSTVKDASRVKAQKHSFLVETISNMRTIKEGAVEHIWADRYRDMSAGAALAHHATAQVSFLFQTLAQTVMLASGLATLSVGIGLAVSGEISLGTLIAATALTWRVLSPIQNLFLTFARAEQAKVAIGQVNSLMKLKGEEEQKKQSSGVERAWQGGVSFSRVSLRYSQQSEPALLGVGFSLSPGEFLAISGSNGSGKSSILRVLMGLQRPQGGQITLDGVDIRQIPPTELRMTLAYVPQQPTLFHGSVAQNLRLGNPTAQDDDLRAACVLAGVLEDVEALPEGFETRVGDQNIWQMNSGLRQKLALARAYVADTPVLLLDEPAHALDDQGDRVLMETLKELHYKKTIIMVSHRPSHVRLADKLIMMHRGSITAIGTPDEVYEKTSGAR